jgi:hypothetical protein
MAMTTFSGLFGHAVFTPSSATPGVQQPIQAEGA